MGFWDKLKRDIKKGFDEGLDVIKEGTEVTKKKAGVVYEDLKKKIKAFEMKQKVQAYLTDLGGRVYEIASESRKNPLLDEKVKKILERIRKADLQISKLEAEVKEITKKTVKKVKTVKTPSQKAAARKKTVRQTAKKASPKKSTTTKKRTKTAKSSS
jgi:vacuolar-type H+-ATPase subunit I/STV1